MSNQVENGSSSCGVNCPTARPIVIIGSGSAAFAAATQLAQTGKRVKVIEAQPQIGGTCVNVGCVPSKILIQAAKLAHETEQTAFEGLQMNQACVLREKLAQQIQARVDELRYAKYEKLLETYPNISVMRGRAKFLSASKIQVIGIDYQTAEIEVDKVLIATGSIPLIPKIAGLKGTPFWTSTEALFATKTPKHLMVLGASVVALEIAQAFLRLGSQVTVLARSTLLSREDAALGAELQQALEAEGMVVYTNVTPDKIDYVDGLFQCQLNDSTPLEADQLLVATGRQANTAELGLALAGVEIDAKGQIKVNAHLQTSQPNIYAAGDCTQLPQFVYVAAAAGTRAAKNILGGDETIQLETLPTVVFTDPQVANVGLNPAQAQQQNIEVIVRKLSLENVPRALANFNTTGFVQLVAEAKTQRILGAQILADVAGEMIQTATLAIAQKMTISDLANTLFPYLTQVEALKLCAQTFTQDVSQLSCCSG